jgi:GTPase
VSLDQSSETAGLAGGQRAWVVHPSIISPKEGARAPEARLDEAVGLARAIDLEVCGASVLPLRTRRPATLFGTGQIERLADEMAAANVSLLIVDAALTPVQQRNLEQSLKVKVIDRTGLILEIFGARAQTREGVMQVELAHLSYQQSRLVRSWTHLERQRGGFGFLGGPGESQLETDRRLIRERIARLRGSLDAVRRTRGLHRRQRQRAPYPVIALVGYTNAGKSTLFNRLTGSDVLAQDLLFATLDPTLRATETAGGKIILSDTVGFISELPTQLVAAFRSTLEEVVEADIIIHVRDIAHEDTEAQKADVEDVLADLGVTAPVIEALNKVDLLSPESEDRLRAQAHRRDDAVVISALTGEGIDALLARAVAQISAPRRLRHLVLDASDGERLAWLYRHGEVVRRDCQQNALLEVDVRLSDTDLARWNALATR